MSKEQRENLILRFRTGETWILITTDLLSRGIDFKNIQVVVNFECPYNNINYIHRIGRTGRAGNIGTAITLVTDDDYNKLKTFKHIIQNSPNCECPDWVLRIS